MAYVVAYIRATKYKRFLKKTQGLSRNKKHPTQGIRGSLCSPHCFYLIRCYLRSVTKAIPPVFLIYLACEWQGYSESPQYVSLEIDEKKRLQIYGENGSPVRTHNIGTQDLLEVFLSNDHQHRALLLKIPKEYDLVGNNYVEHFHIFKSTAVRKYVSKCTN